MCDLPVPFGPSSTTSKLRSTNGISRVRAMSLPRSLNCSGLRLIDCISKVNPFLSCELRACFVVVVDVDAGDLDGLEAPEDPRHDTLVVGVKVFDVADAPDAPTRSLGFCFTVRSSTMTPLTWRFSNSASWTSFFSLRVTVTLSITR